MRRVRVELRCAQCGFAAPQDALDLLRRAGMLKRAGDDVDEYLVKALLAVVGERLACEQCGHTPLLCEAIEDDDEIDQWSADHASSPNRACGQCGQMISIERLRLFPESELCVACQQRREQGIVDGSDREFCPWCGQVLSQKTTRRRGVTEYVPACPACGYVG